MRSEFKKTVFLIIVSAFAPLWAAGKGPGPEEARDTLFSDVYLDTVNIERKMPINDYSMIGVLYGVAINRTMFNPSKKQTSLITPVNIGIFYTKYGKMFGYMPYFGMQAGIIYGKEGYQFKANDKGVMPTLDGAEKAVYEFVEMPVMSHFHLDAGLFKLIANLGMYGGYRLSVKRYGKLKNTFYENNFYSYDRRLDYGIRGGAGFAFMFSPVEIHISALIKYSMSSLYEPDYNSPYYYRFAYPFDVAITVGLHFQLTKRTGKTKAALRKEAYKMVFDENKQAQKKLEARIKFEEEDNNNNEQ